MKRRGVERGCGAVDRWEHLGMDVGLHCHCHWDWEMSKRLEWSGYMHKGTSTYLANLASQGDLRTVPRLREYGVMVFSWTGDMSCGERVGRSPLG